MNEYLDPTEDYNTGMWFRSHRRLDVITYACDNLITILVKGAPEQHVNQLSVGNQFWIFVWKKELLSSYSYLFHAKS